MEWLRLHIWSAS